MTSESRTGRVEVDLGQTSVSGDGRANIHVQPRHPLRPTMLQVPDDVARHFVVEKVAVGDVVLAGDPCPATDFTGEGRLLDPRPIVGSEKLADRTPRVAPTRFITISVLCTGREPQVFRGIVSGPAADWLPGEEQLFRQE